MGAGKRRGRGQTKTQHTRGEAKHKQARAARDTPTRDKPQTRTHMSAKASMQHATADNLKPPQLRDKKGRAMGPAGHPSKGIQAGPAQRRVVAAHRVA
jgi:hypothetical protein